MKYFTLKTKICFVMVSLLFGGILIFSLMCACPIDKGECNKGRKPVLFPHDMHMDSFDCEVCHHVYDKEKNNVLDVDELYSDNPDIMCSFCHASDNRIDFQEAFHRKCIGCHTEEAAKSQAAPPTKCNQCHNVNSMVSEESDIVIMRAK